ncbi:multicopper oxidase domain-containing protein [Ammoniphilus sp. 3BR4]|uniref:multicopper oxidase domain-containing protein n=1 Tax=Ammoniphilus sp. 3BR4 TaxID=3158265 RepID=UPI003465ABAF
MKTLKYISLISSLAMIFLPADSGWTMEMHHQHGKKAFLDIQGHWAQMPITQLVNSGVINGFEDGTFRPMGDVTREQFVTMLVQAKGFDLVKGKTSFSDVAESRWSNPYIEAALDAGVMAKGEYGSAFSPNQPISRQEMAIMAARSLALPLNEKASSFKDRAKVERHAGLIGAAVQAGIVTGFPDGTFRPADRVTRAQAAVIIARASNYNPNVKEVTLVAKEAPWQVSSDMTKVVWAFNGKVPGTEIRIKEGNTLRAKLVNELPEPVTIHWHGIPLPNPMDGVPGMTQNAVQPGQSFIYEFKANVPGTYMYHSHQKGVEQVNKGLFGALIVEEKDPKVQYDRDYAVMLDAFGMNGKTGEMIPKLSVQNGERVKLRLLNIGRTEYDVYFHGAEYKVTHTDGQPIRQPQAIRNALLTIAPGERYDLEFIADSSQETYLAKVQQGNILAASRVDFQFPGQNQARQGNPISAKSLLALTEYGQAVEESRQEWAAFDVEYEMALDKNGRDEYTINGKVMHDLEPILVNKGQKVKVTMRNVDQEDHPMHLHGHFFQVLSKNGKPISGSPLWKDTLNVRPGETYEVAFITDNPGNWMFHCHKFQHAAAGMGTSISYRDYLLHFTPDPNAGNQME